VLVNLSGRGDKDTRTVAALEGTTLGEPALAVPA